MLQEMFSEHWKDEEGRPAGGVTFAPGFAISWQNGPLGRHTPGCVEGGTCGEGCTRRAPNGAFVETVLAAAKDRLLFYQAHTGFACKSNEDAIEAINLALESLDRRTRDRVARGVEGTHIQ